MNVILSGAEGRHSFITPPSQCCQYNFSKMSSHGKYKLSPAILSIRIFHRFLHTNTLHNPATTQPISESPAIYSALHSEFLSGRCTAGYAKVQSSAPLPSFPDVYLFADNRSSSGNRR